MPGASQTDIAERIAAIPEAIADALAGDPEVPRGLLACRSFDVCGLGASAGPAALLVEILRELGLSAAFRPMSVFLDSAQPRSEALIVFSQGLSPNARLAIARAPAYRHSLLFTAVHEGSSPERQQARFAAERLGMWVWPHGPTAEPGSLVRLLGPACASACALGFARRLAAAAAIPLSPVLTSLEHLPAHLGRIAAGPLKPITSDPVAWLVVGQSTGPFESLAWKWQEALLRPLAPTLDLLSFTHGPLQATLHQPGPLVVLHRDTARHLDLLERLLSIVGASRPVVSLVSDLPGPLRLFEDEVSVHASILQAMRTRGIRPGEWPGQNEDAPLYEIGRRDLPGSE